MLAVNDAGISLEDVVSVGVGTPGSVNKDTGQIEFANNLDFNNVPAKEMLEERIGKPVYLDNDANCAALGEAVAGAGKGVAGFVAITLGTGVGSGIIIDGKIVTGVNFAAGEMGHMVITVDGEQCNCGRRGCWERYASATALISQTKDAMRHNQNSIMWQLVNDNIDAVSGRTAFDAMKKGDAAAEKVVARYIYMCLPGSLTSSMRCSRKFFASVAVSATKAKICWHPSASMSSVSATAFTPRNKQKSARQNSVTMRVLSAPRCWTADFGRNHGRDF
jgi:glucokinase-like ROK family protein